MGKENNKKIIKFIIYSIWIYIRIILSSSFSIEIKLFLLVDGDARLEHAVEHILETHLVHIRAFAESASKANAPLVSEPRTT